MASSGTWTGGKGILLVRWRRFRDGLPVTLIHRDVIRRRRVYRRAGKRQESDFDRLARRLQLGTEHFPMNRQADK
jgi:hypothetical protein